MGAVLCLAKTTEWFFHVRRYRRSQCFGGISTCCAGVRFTVETVGKIKSVFDATDARCKYEDEGINVSSCDVLYQDV